MMKKIIILGGILLSNFIFCQTVPINDNCANAINITPQLPCNLISGNLSGATISGLPKASCDVSSSSSLKDVWFKFTASSPNHTITLFPSSGLDGVLALYNACNGVEIGCSDNGGGAGGIEKIYATGLNIGSTYYIRVYPYGSSVPSTTSFSLCIINPLNTLASPSVNCSKTYITTIENRDVYKHNSSGFILYKAKMAIDADGHPCAYGPNDSGLDYTANAGYPGNWWGIVTDANGNPIIQGASDPCPGMYVSTTSLVNSAYPVTNPLRYTNSGTVPFYVIPNSLKSMANIQLGDVAYVYNTQNGLGSFAILADIGPSGKLGEGSMQLAQRLGINPNPKTGGTSNPIIYYIIFPNSGFGQGKIPTNNQIDSIGNGTFYPNGGLSIIPCIENITTEIENFLFTKDKMFLIYPNPVKDKIIQGYSKIEGIQNFHISLIDLTGKILYSNEVKSENGYFSIYLDKEIPKSFYILLISYDNNQYFEKIIIE
jgi:hypothetical protein